MADFYDLNGAGPQHGAATDKPRGQPWAGTEGDALAAFRDAAVQRGVVLPPDIIADGEIHRCDTTGHHGEGDAAYLLHLDEFPAGGFQNHQDGIGWEDWHVEVGRKLNPFEAARLQARADADRVKREAVRAETRASTAERAAALWAKAIDDPEHPYLARKGIAAHGTKREDRTDFLLVPMRDEHGALHNIQRIDPACAKRFLKGGVKQGCFFSIGQATTTGPILIAEGFSTAATIHEATGLPTVAAFDAGNLAAVAQLVRRTCKDDAIILICGDDDWRATLPDGTAHNTGKVKAEEAAHQVGAGAVFPAFGDDRAEGETDFNDMGQRFGLAAVKQQIEAALAAPITVPEITSPAASLTDVEGMIRQLDRNSRGTENERQTMTMALRGLAKLNLGLVAEEPLIKQIATRTSIQVQQVRKMFSTFKREAGVPAVLVPAMTEVCRRYVYVKALGSFWDRQARTVFEAKAVQMMHRRDMPTDEDTGKQADPLSILLDGVMCPPCDAVDAITFVPGNDEIFQEGEQAVLNIWTRPSVVSIEPKDESEIAPFLNHVSYILDGEHQVIEHVYNYLAHLVQKGHEKIKSAILIIGAFGIGKSCIGEMMMHLLGEENVTAIEDSDLRSAFNEWMDGIQLVIINELMSCDTREALTRLKSYITDPWIRINRKRVPTYKYRNRANFLMFSNYEDAARLEVGDRRFMVHKSKAVKRDKVYYTALWDWFNNGGAERLLWWLQHRDLSGFDANEEPPMTESKAEVIADSRGAVEAYLQDLFDAGAAPFRHDLVVVTQIIKYLADKHDQRTTHKQITHFLRKIEATSLGQRWLKDGTRPSIWAIRDGAEWEETGPEDIKEAWRDIEDATLHIALRNEILGRTRTFEEP